MNSTLRMGGAGVVSAVALLAAIAAPTQGATAEDRAPLHAAKAEAIRGSYIVMLKNEMSTAATRAAVDRAKGAGASVKHVYSTLKGYSATMTAAQLDKVRADPNVAFVQEDSTVSLSTTQNNATWGLDRVDQRNLPLNSTYNYTPTGQGVRAYIIDTGVLTTHSEFTGRTASGYTAISDGRGTTDCNGHGTHVAGTTAGTTYGVAKQATVIPVRVLGCTGSGSNSGVVAGMDWVAGNASGPSVANMSLGGGADTATDSAVARMTNAGVTVVVAAGNDNANACNYSPARAASAITVASSTNTDARSSFSNYGSCIDIFAPGSNITSAWYTSTSATNTISGTSMASPHVAGAAALYLQGNPTASPATVTSALNSAATTNVITGVNGSPNRLLYTNPGTSPTPTPTPTPTPGTERVTNGTFESGSTGWSGTAGVINTSTYPAYAGSYKAWLNGYGSTSTEQVYQSVSIPSTATTATLSYYLRVDSAETTTSTVYDRLTVSLGSTTVATYSNLNESTGYLKRTFDVSAFKGQTVTLKFYGTEDSSLQTSFLIDNVSLATS